MRPQLLHLSGPLRGRTVTYDDTTLEVGSAPGIDLQIAHPAVAGHHAAIDWHEQDCAFVLRAIDGRVFVNRDEIREVMLVDGDLIEWGEGGPRARFRAYWPPGSVCKPVRRMLADARDVKRHSGGAAAAGGLTRDLLTQATPQLKVGFPLLVVLAALPLAWLAGWLGSRPSVARERADAVALRELEEVRAAQREQASAIAQLNALNRVTAEVQKKWSRGVCLVHGIVRVRWPNGDYVLGGDGAPLAVEYTGSGFLAAADGAVLTNRHVVTPWEAIEPLRTLAEGGGQPEFATLTATFPGRPPRAVAIDAIRRRGDDLDVAAFRLPVDAIAGLPVLPLHEGPLNDLPDQRAIVVGYPTGLAALLAKADNALVADLRARQADMTTVIQALADADRISPVLTQGTVGNVQDRMIVYDAPTTHGGSGGPVFGADGTVIAVNYAVLREFTGANFGVPIEFGRELLR